MFNRVIDRVESLNSTTLKRWDEKSNEVGVVNFVGGGFVTFALDYAIAKYNQVSSDFRFGKTTFFI